MRTARSARRAASRARPSSCSCSRRASRPDDRVALETTGNALSIARILEPHVAGVLVADTRNVRAMTHAKVKNDRVDAQLIAKLLAAGMLPGRGSATSRPGSCAAGSRGARSWSAAAPGRATRFTRSLIRNLGGRAPASDMFGKKGREWLQSLELPADERATIVSCLREADFLARELAQVDREIARYAIGCAEIRRLMTIPGVDVTTAATLMATIGRIDRFASPRHLVGYLGLDPRSRQSGPCAVHTATSQSRARRPPATCSAKPRTPRCAPPARCARSASASRKRRGSKIATVAVARKLACLTWQLLTTQQDYIYERPALTFRKLRQLELAAGAPKRSNPRGSHGPATPDTPAQWATEREAALDVEDALPRRRRRLAAPATTLRSHLTTSVGRIF